jgi:hypothetical protein
MGHVASRGFAARDTEASEMRKLAIALAIGLLTSAGGVGVSVAPATAATPSQLKVVIVVGATGGVTSSYRANADAYAADFAKYTTNIVKVYSPNATWSAVQSAAQGAAVLVYLGHGSGYPNPYVSYLQPDGDNGMGLNASASGSDTNTQYYGENYMAQLNLASNALVLLNHLCYASGDNEWGAGLPSLATAQTRVDGYASGFLRGNARTVIAEGVSDLGPYIDAVFTAKESMDQMWKTYPSFHNHVTSWASSRNSGYTSQIDPDLGNPAPDGDVYYRSMVTWPGTTTDTVGIVKSDAATYHPMTPTRLLNTIDGSGGLSGKFVSHVARTFQVTGNAGIPAGATAVTGNLTITQQNSLGYAFIGPVAMNWPASSTINFPAWDDRANSVTVNLGIGGILAITYAASDLSATAHVIFDVTGYYTNDLNAATYYPLNPTRILDTRPTVPSGNPTNTGGILGPVGTGAPQNFQVTGVGGVPSGATAVTGNLTVTEQSSRGGIYLGPVSNASPTIFTLDFPVGDNRANSVTMMLGTGGKLFFTFVGASAGQAAQVIFDVTGYFMPGTGGGAFHALTPARILDSRPTVPSGNPINVGLSGYFWAHQARTFQVTGMGGVPGNATAVVGNMTVTQQTDLGYLFIGPIAMNWPGSSNLNFPIGDNRANAVTVTLGSGGRLSVTYAVSNMSSSGHVIFDVAGYFTPATG